MKRTKILISGGVCIAFIVAFFIYLIVASKPAPIVPSSTKSIDMIQPGFFATQDVKDILSKKSYGTVPLSVPADSQSNPFGALE